MVQSRMSIRVDTFLKSSYSCVYTHHACSCSFIPYSIVHVLHFGAKARPFSSQVRLFYVALVQPLEAVWPRECTEISSGGHAVATPTSRPPAGTTITRPQMMVTLSRCLQCFPYSTRKHAYGCFLVSPFMDYTSRARAMNIK